MPRLTPVRHEKTFVITVLAMAAKCYKAFMILEFVYHLLHMSDHETRK